MHLLSRSISETVFSHTVKRYMEEDHIMGCSIALLQHGELTLAAHYGYASLQKTPVDDLTLFECASLTKMHFAVMALKFCEDGLFSLDRPVMEQFPVIPWSDDPRFSAITPRHLLSHTSGLPNWASKPMPLLAPVIRMTLLSMVIYIAFPGQNNARKNRETPDRASGRHGLSQEGRSEYQGKYRIEIDIVG